MIARAQIQVMRLFELHAELWLPRPRAEVFPFFADARNLETLTPPWLRFEILTPLPIEMRAGRLIDYRLRLHGLPLRWRSEITVWEPPVRFVDEQRRGPYRFWAHEHRFVEQNGGTLVVDHVRYAVWGGRLIAAVFVRPDLNRIFAYRRDKLLALFGTATPAPSPRPAPPPAGGEGKRRPLKVEQRCPLHHGALAVARGLPVGEVPSSRPSPLQAGVRGVSTSRKPRWNILLLRKRGSEWCRACGTG